MTTPYRNDIDALSERKATLEREIAQIKDQTTQLEGLRAQQQELERELAAVAQKVGAKRALPLLDSVRVASPCNASWDKMVGDDRVRFCGSCEKNVFNLSAMSAPEAEQLLRDRASGETCIRFYQRADGTVMTEDCPVGVKKKRRKKIALAVAGAGAMAVAAATAAFRGAGCQTMGKMEVMGEMAVAVPTNTATTASANPIIGALPPPPPEEVKPVTPPKPPHSVKMGKRAR